SHRFRKTHRLSGITEWHWASAGMRAPDQRKRRSGSRRPWVTQLWHHSGVQRFSYEVLCTLPTKLATRLRQSSDKDSDKGDGSHLLQSARLAQMSGSIRSLTAGSLPVESPIEFPVEATHLKTDHRPERRCAGREAPITAVHILAIRHGRLDGN